MALAGQRVMGVDFPSTVSGSDSNNGTTTSTSYTATLAGGVSAASTTFTAPTSGQVLVYNMARMVNSGANETYCSFEIREGNAVGSGTVVYAAQDERGTIHVGTGVERQAHVFLATGLTPGSVYNIQQQFRVSAGTGTYAYRLLIVAPAT